MALTLAKNSRARCSHVWKLLLLALPLFGILLMGCNNACFILTSNPPAGTINIKGGDSKPTHAHDSECRRSRSNTYCVRVQFLLGI